MFGVIRQGSVTRRGLWWSRWWRTRIQDSFMRSRKGFQKVKPLFILNKENLGLPQGRKMSLQEGSVSSKVTTYLNHT